MQKPLDRTYFKNVIRLVQVRRTNLSGRRHSKLKLNTQIKKYRTAMNLTQDELAEQIYVTRQTISNWENNKNYPDIHSLLLLSSLFNISLDQLIKGDIDIMKTEIKEADLKKFDQDSKIFIVLLITTLFSCVPFALFWNYLGLLITLILFCITFFYALKVEKFKKENDIQTYKEIVAFTEGKRLDEIEKQQEYGKRPYQQAFYILGSALLAFLVSISFVWLSKHLL